MSDQIIELMHRNIREIFEESDPARRRAAIEQLFVEDCIVHAPPGVFQGWDALDKLTGELRDSHPDFKYTPKGEPQVLQDAGIIAWDSGPSSQTPVYSGLDVIITRAGRIGSLYVFLNPKLA